jgi:integrase
MKKNLTHQTVAALKPPATGQIDYWDKRKPGFGIRVSKGGTKTWLVMYRQQGRKKRCPLGHFPDMSVADARAKATATMGDVAKGADPAAERAQAKAEPTFGKLAELYLERHAKVHKRPRSAHEDVLMLNAELLPVWRDRKLSAIHKKDVIALLDSIAARAPIKANRVRALASTMFNFAIGRDLLEHSPVYKVPRPAPERSRDRRLSDGEICRLWTAVEVEPAKVQAVCKLALLTAARRGELLGMAWSELDLDAGWWVLPGSRTKNGIEHRIPLSPTAIGLLRALEARGSGASPFVFPGGRTGRPVANPQEWILRIRARAGLENFRFHDLRRTVASGMTAIGVPRLTVSKLLNHTEGGITAVYDRTSYDTEKRAAVVRWDRHLERLLTPDKDSSNVVQLHG